MHIQATGVKKDETKVLCIDWLSSLGARESNRVDMAYNESAFINFLLVAPYDQVAVLLNRLSAGQVLAVSEIFLNILLGEELDEQVLAELKPHTALIRKIGNRNLPASERRRLISNRPHVTVNIIRKVQSILPDVSPPPP
jgi:hypothetical protein